jgi:UDP-N-acetylmuramate-alanine ligase
LVADAVAAAGGSVAYVRRRADLAEAVAEEAAEGDVVLMMGAGDITLAADEVVARLGDLG